MNYTIEEIKTHVVRLFAMLGHQTDVNSVNMISNLLIEELPLHKTIDFKEFKYLTELGVKHELGEVVHLSFSTICKMIKDYKASEFKKKYDKTKFIQRDELPELTQSAKDEIFKKSIIPALRSENCFEASLPVYYDFLAEKGLIDINTGAILYLEQAKEKLATDLEKEKLKAGMELDAKKSKEIGKKIESLLSGETDKNDVKHLAKILYMKSIDLIELEKELSK